MRIGLTGGVATGKTTVSHYLGEKYQLPILDADIYARDAVAKRSPILLEIASRYGESILLADGSLDRRKLGEIIFHQPPEKIWLESKIHPYVRACFEERLKQLKGLVAVLVIPLLFEASMTDLVDSIWVVSCSESEQLRRLIERDRLSYAQAIARMNSQLPIEIKIALANVVLENSSSLEELYKQIDQEIARLDC